VLFLLILGGIYSLTFGNVGTAYRQRAQLMPYLLVFAAMRVERWKQVRPVGREVPRGASAVPTC
jgi:hypothetical protein